MPCMLWACFSVELVLLPHQLVLLESFFTSTVVVFRLSGCRDLTWRYKLQAQTDTVQPLLDQFPGLTLFDALF